MKKYELTNEHRKELKPWADKWITNAMRTRGMDDEDRAAMRKAVKGLYEAANLTPPPDHRIVFVPSPFVLRFAGGFAAAIWHLRSKGKLPATNAATRAATYAATRAATYDATNAATNAATRAATRAATYDAKNKIFNPDAYWQFPIKAMIGLEKTLGIAALGLSCAQRAWSMWNGGNQWSAWVSFLSFFRHIAKLGIDYSKWQHYENAAIHGAHRIMHPEFCMISDFPEVLTVDAQNRPHGETGPFCRWRDGSALYALHGVYVPAWAIETPKDQIDPAKVLAIQNVDERAEVIRHVGVERLFDKLQPTLLERKEIKVGKDLVPYELYQLDIGFTVPRILLKMWNRSEDKIHLEHVHKDCRTVEEALNFRNFGEVKKEFIAPLALT